MKIICLFGNFRSEPECVELLCAWDGFCADNDPEGMEEAFEAAAKARGSDLLETRRVWIDVSQAQVQERFDTPVLAGTVLPEEEG